MRPDFNWNDEGVRTILRIMGPAIIAASSVQVNVMVNTWFASWLEDGTAYRLNIAFRLMQLPLGIFGVAIGTVTLPRHRSVERRAVLGFATGLALHQTDRLAIHHVDGRQQNQRHVGQPSAPTQLVSNAAPASPLFSGWNWVADNGPSSTAARNGT